MSREYRYLLILGDREAIAWVLREQRMAFPATPRAEVAALASGDRLFLYSTQGAWHNPPRDRGRVIGTAEVESPVRALDEPLEIAGRIFHSGCTLSVRSLAPYPQGWSCSRWSRSWRRSRSRMPGRSICAVPCFGCRLATRAC